MLKNITLLYVEDEDSVRNITTDYFSTLFKEIISARDGNEGFELFKTNKEHIDIIVTDINMPKLNGIDMIKKIRSIDTNIPIIITTAYNDNKFLQDAISLGVRDFVLKPVDLKELLDSIKKTLEPLLLKENLEKEKIRNAKSTASEQLSAGITHEINTPLTYIKANFEMIGYDLEDIPDSDSKESIKQSISKIQCGIKRIENIVNSIKELSQGSDEKFECTNIYSTIITALTITYNKIKHITKVFINGEEFSLDLDKNKYKYYSYVQIHRIEQLWIIIIINALDELVKVENFDNRKLSIDISENDEFLKIIFKDNAGGIKEDLLNDIFEPFKGSKDSSGMGVGLSIAKKIIQEQNNASIKAYNDAHNAVFEISLPKKKD